MKKCVSLESPKYSKLLFAACFAVYAASYVGRINYSAALVSIAAEGLFTKSHAGVIASVFFVAYGSCQVIWGFLGDRVSPFKMIITGTLFAALSNLAFSFSKSFLAMAVIWGINGVSHSMLWSPILRVLSNVINKDLRAKACLNLSLSLPAGTVLAYLTASVIIKFYNWRYVFSAAFAVLSLALCLFVFVLIKIRPHLSFTAAPLAEAAPPSEGSGIHKKKTLAVFLSSGLLFAVLPTALHGMLKEGITTWVPTMVTEVYGASASFSVFLSVFLPLFNATGAYLITPVYKGVMKKNEMTTAAFCMLVAAVPLTALLFMNRIAPLISVILMAAATAAAHTFNYMLITLVPVRFARYGRTATVTGLMNAAAYAGCAVSTYSFGAIAERLGWHCIVYVWLGLSFTAAAACIFIAKRWKYFCKNMEDKA